MLQMKKNTKAKIGTLAASGLALASVLGLVQQNALPSSQSSRVAASAPQASAALVQPTTTGANSSASVAVTPTAAASSASTDGQSVKAAVTPAVNTRTHVS